MADCIRFVASYIDECNAAGYRVNVTFTPNCTVLRYCNRGIASSAFIGEHEDPSSSYAVFIRDLKKILAKSATRGYESTVVSSTEQIKFIYESKALRMSTSDGDKSIHSGTIITIRGVNELSSTRVYFLSLLNSSSTVPKEHVMSGCPHSDALIDISSSIDAHLPRRVYLNGVLISVLGYVGGHSICTFQKGITAREIAHDGYVPCLSVRDTSFDKK